MVELSVDIFDDAEDDGLNNDKGDVAAVFFCLVQSNVLCDGDVPPFLRCIAPSGCRG